MKKQGFIFIDYKGHYAREISSSSFGNKQELTWVTDLNDATVFDHEDSTVRKHPLLRTCQALEAHLSIVVNITKWKREPVTAEPKGTENDET